MATLCPQCDERPNVIYCENCDDVFCSECSTSFHRKGRMVMHRMRSVAPGVVQAGSNGEADSVPLLCSAHPERELTFFSVTSNQCICEECTETNYRTDSKVLPLALAVTDIKKEYANRVLSLEEHIREANFFLAQLDSFQDEIATSVQEASAAVHSAFQGFMELLVKKEADILTDIDTYGAWKQQLISGQKIFVASRGQILQSLVAQLQAQQDLEGVQFMHARNMLNLELEKVGQIRIRPFPTVDSSVPYLKHLKHVNDVAAVLHKMPTPPMKRSGEQAFYESHKLEKLGKTLAPAAQRYRAQTIAGGQGAPRPGGGNVGGGRSAGDDLVIGRPNPADFKHLAHVDADGAARMMTDVPDVPSAPKPAAEAQDTGAKALAVATFDFEGSSEGELSFKKGDVVIVLGEAEGGWQAGMFRGEIGWFPTDYVEIKASVSYGSFFCLECSGRHRGLGVHLSFVRSCGMDTWKDEELAKMREGGNKRMQTFFEKGGIPAGTSIKLKYNTTVAEVYRKQLTAIVRGEPWSEPDFAALRPLTQQELHDLQAEQEQQSVQTGKRMTPAERGSGSGGEKPWHQTSQGFGNASYQGGGGSGNSGSWGSWFASVSSAAEIALSKVNEKVSESVQKASESISQLSQQAQNEADSTTEEEGLSAALKNLKPTGNGKYQGVGYKDVQSHPPTKIHHPSPSPSMVAPKPPQPAAAAAESVVVSQWENDIVVVEEDHFTARATLDAPSTSTLQPSQDAAADGWDNTFDDDGDDGW